ncbi:NTP transferase domain-containing protein [Psychrobacter arenosus]|uniref:nucleotidyltransferase family protein n=1 Tax=Psychrobacter arenosus TaxID=256326 RepID=UPI00191938DE|nr:nucleotidyltransferase family protein [Psychrobacter arenosus]
MTALTSFNSLTDQSTHHNPKRSPHCVILLAAGQSSRLGQPKQLLKIKDQSLLRHMAQLALATTPVNVSVVVPKTCPEIGQSLEGLAVDLVANPAPETGMALSLSLAIDAMQDKLIEPATTLPPDPAVIIMGVDQVRLTSTHLQQLLTQYQACEYTLVTASQYAGVIGLPLVIRWPQLLAWQPQLSGDKGLRKLIRALPDSSYSTIDFPELAHDIDTPEQYEEARQQGWLD